MKRRRLTQGAVINHRWHGQLVVRVTLRPDTTPPELWEALGVRSGKPVAPSAYSERGLHSLLRQNFGTYEFLA